MGNRCGSCWLSRDRCVAQLRRQSVPCCEDCDHEVSEV